MWDCHQLIGLRVSAEDGEVGRLRDLCFDDERWMIRYFIVDSARPGAREIVVGVDLVADALGGDGRDQPEPEVFETARTWSGPEQLRRVEEVRGFRVAAPDGDVGRVDAFLISEATWAISYVIVEMSVGARSRKVVMLPCWIRSIDPEGRTMHLSVPTTAVLASPEFADDIHDAYESCLLRGAPRADA